MLNRTVWPRTADLTFVGGVVQLQSEIIDNPKDGVWLFARYLSSPRDPTLIGQEEMIFAQDVVEIRASGG